ncbi:phenylalanine-tRNA ligase [Cavenderia fasciculata]|uniref:phenylalanine--tRNA ligase n=1 Tax=Cavenderia fasciculata TaxID=261658 RepID=F4PUT8_CACFS|nr:phenylalanine-tRNA ligase [Cavenderia fasciculata]EGG21107.1 phenylalanine-tRNA ligase [Cavenderia fasciculata]|eukprot:XP_004358957.1 phenylalanine-tRNA ligase [Cavenderia fasciculata]
MPTVQVSRDLLFKSLGKTYTYKQFDDLCFDYGIELDGETSEREMKLKETGVDDPNASSVVLYKIDVPANRYDLLCLEGLSRALKVYDLATPIPKYTITPPASGKHQKLIVSKEVKGVRPIVVCGILRNVTFNQDTYQSFIDLQEKLHANICKKRTLVSIGTHDLDTIKGPFTYKALPPKDIKFVPLSQTQEYDAVSLFEFYEKTSSHLKKYLHIIDKSPLYPAIYDSNNVLCSLPPIINGDHSKITLNTKNVFIEVTANDYTKANIVLNVMLTMFSEYSKTPYSMEQVEVVDADGKSDLFPKIDEKTIDASTSYINKTIGANIDPANMVGMLKRMSLISTLSQDKSTLTVSVPCTRSDIIHQCDIMEDVAIGYGFNNIARVIPVVNTVGRIQPINKLSELLSNEAALAGYTEIMTFVLSSNKDNFALINRKDDNSSVKIENYLMEEFSEVRTTLISTLLKTIVSNRAHGIPLKLYEVSDVVIKGANNNKNLSDPDSNNSDVGALNKRMFGAITADSSSKLEIVHGLLDKLMLSLKCKPELLMTKQDREKGIASYQLAKSSDKIFVEGMGVDILYNGTKIGIMGVVNPEVLKNYGIIYPCSILEFEITIDLAKNII